MTAPEWLTKRDGSLKAGVGQQIWFVMLGGKPQYRLNVRPAGGLFACAVVQSVNGHRVDKDLKYANAEAAMAGGLDQLRATLGW